MDTLPQELEHIDENLNYIKAIRELSRKIDNLSNSYASINAKLEHIEDVPDMLQVLENKVCKKSDKISFLYEASKQNSQWCLRIMDNNNKTNFEE